MASVLIFTFICLFSFSSLISDKPEAIHLEMADSFQQESLETYIVHVSLPDGVDSVAHQFDGLDNYYHSFLPRDAKGSSDVSRIVYTYSHVITGFAAKLSLEELKEMEKKEGFLDARSSRTLTLHTTQSHNFLGLHQHHGLWPELGYGEGLIIGILDDGIKPDHPSFSDVGVPPPPPTWKGKCDFKGFKCNNKIIGGRKFFGGTGEPVDEGEHGDHTASIAAGNFVENANVFGKALGTAAGTAPRAHLAIYQVCMDGGCNDEDVLAGMDTALRDGVHLLSLSLGRGVGIGTRIPFYDDIIGVGAFHAMENGTFVSCSAGNSGPKNGGLSNEAPWILTVGASSIDRNLRATAILGNKKEFDGESLFQPKDFPSKFLPLVYPGQNGDPYAAKCDAGSLNSSFVRGKVVLCEGGYIGIAQGQNVKEAGGAAMILMNSEHQEFTIIAKAHVLPAIDVSFAAGQAIKAYINSRLSSTVKIVFKGTILGVKNAPEVAFFSSRGPSLASPGILKPDIVGPGLNILGAWPYSVDNITDSTSTLSTFNIISGTSMSCPHLTGIAALLKRMHCDWSPAAIKSAIMTTADVLDRNNNIINDERRLPADVFAVGAGHVNPLRAVDPGLIYDIKPDDYIPYLCGLGYSDKNIKVIVGHHVSCADIGSITEAQLNYPSFAIQLGNTTLKYSRTLTNVGLTPSTYEVKIDSVPEVDISVRPRVLNFTQEKQQLSYEISFTRLLPSAEWLYRQGAITWISNRYTVRSPISVNFV